MKIYLKLIKVFFKENFSFDRLLGSSVKKSKAKTIILGFLIIFGLASLLLSFGYLFFELGEAFKMLGTLESLLMYIFIYATFISTFFIILRANSYLFHYKDYDFLASLPIKNEIVLAAKITVMMIMIYLSTYIISAPIIYSYLYHSGFTIYQFIAIILLILFIPILPLIIFSFLALLINQVITKFRLGKIINALLTFGLLLGYMYFVFSMNSTAANPLLNQQDFIDGISRYIPTARLYQNAVANQDILQFLLFVIINGALLIGYIYLVKSLVNKVNQKRVKIFRRKNKKYRYKQNSITETLVKKEFNKFFSINIYLLNSGFGPLLMFAGSVLALVYSNQIESFSAEAIGANLNIELSLLIIVGFFISTVFTSAISLSLEGKNFWILRTLPIPAKTVMMSKMIFNVLLGLPFAILLTGAVGFSLNLDILMILLMMALIASYSLVTSIIGSIINLHFPKFHFKNETEVVKQSAGAFLGMFSGWIIIAVFGLLKAFVFKSLDNIPLFSIYLAINILIFYICYLYIDKKAESLFIKYS